MRFYILALCLVSSSFALENNGTMKFPYVSIWEKNDYLVSLVDATSGNHFCFGTLISARAILTSASCLWKQSHVDPNRIEVYFSPSIGSQISVCDIVTHDRYDPEEDQHDVALLFLKKFAKIIFKPSPTKLAIGRIEDENVFAIEMVERDQIITKRLTVVNSTFYKFYASCDEEFPLKQQFGGPVLNSMNEIVGVVPFLWDDHCTSKVRSYPKMEAYRFWVKEVLGAFRWFGVEVKYWPKFLVDHLGKK